LSRVDDNARRELDAIAQLLRAIGGGDPAPLDRLRMSRQLRDRSGRLERELVVAARTNGATWQQIGDALGVPRQTAHRRHHARE
jgi:hypothetical protein